MNKELELGDIMSYPTSDHGFYNVEEIPLKVAVAWMEWVQAQVGRVGTFKTPSWSGFWTQYKFYDREVHKCEYQRTFDSWHNKLAMVTQINEMTGTVLAVYKHDDRLMLIRKTKRD